MQYPNFYSSYSPPPSFHEYQHSLEMHHLFQQYKAQTLQAIESRLENERNAFFLFQQKNRLSLISQQQNDRHEHPDILGRRKTYHDTILKYFEKKQTLELKIFENEFRNTALQSLRRPIEWQHEMHHLEIEEKVLKETHQVLEQEELQALARLQTQTEHRLISSHQAPEQKGVPNNTEKTKQITDPPKKQACLCQIL